MTMKTLKGRGLRANLTIRVFFLEGTCHTRRLRTRPGQYMTPEGIEAQLKHEADLIERCFPGREFRLVPLRDGNFNFVEIQPEAALA